jgi:hypothetical protein
LASDAKDPYFKDGTDIPDLAQSCGGPMAAIP